jgi:hypothetical protein
VAIFILRSRFMFTKQHIAYFLVLLFPMLVISALLNIMYSVQAHDYIQLNWIIVLLLALVMDAFTTWIQTKKKKENKTE